jgi:ABC-type cobalamin/Fe3+-siderophores transport system ATPase subunit
VQTLNRMTFPVEPGHVTGFVSPKGAGKTTTIRLLLGFIRPTGGRRSWGRTASGIRPRSTGGWHSCPRGRLRRPVADRLSPMAEASRFTVVAAKLGLRLSRAAADVTFLGSHVSHSYYGMKRKGSGACESWSSGQAVRSAPCLSHS